MHQLSYGLRAPHRRLANPEDPPLRRLVEAPTGLLDPVEWRPRHLLSVVPVISWLDQLINRCLVTWYMGDEGGAVENQHNNIWIYLDICGIIGIYLDIFWWSHAKNIAKMMGMEQETTLCVKKGAVNVMQ